MKDSYAPVLKMLGQRQETDESAIIWIVVVMIALPLLLLLGNYVRVRLQRRHNKERGYEQLEKLGGEKGLTYSEQSLLERIVETARVGNPALMLSSIEVFDRALSTWMKQVMHMPWIAVDDQIEQLTAIRQKIGFRYLPAERPPVSTRELRVGQKIHSLAASKKGLRLISAEIVDLDDLGIATTRFKTPSGSVVKLNRNQDIWGFFWSEGGNEYRFRTRLLKAAKPPAYTLLLQHGDELFRDPKREIFTCAQERELVVAWVSAEGKGANVSPKIFERLENPNTLAISLLAIGGSGCVLGPDAQIDIDDLLRIEESDDQPAFLNGRVCRVIDVTPTGIHARFLDVPIEDHDALLEYIAPQISVKSFRKKLRGKSSRPIEKT